MKQTGVQPDRFSYTLLVKSLAREGKWKGLEVLWAQMRSETLDFADVVIFGTIITGAAATKNVRVAETWFRRMEKEGVVPDVALYNAMMNVYRRAGMFDLAMGVLGKMRSQGLRPDAISFGTLLDACTYAGDRPDKLSQAERLYEEMKAAGYGRDIVACTQLMKVYAQVKAGQRAIELFRDLQRNDAPIDTPCWNSLFSAIGRGGGSPEDVRSLYYEMRASRYRPDEQTYQTLLHIYSAARKTQFVKDLIQDMEADSSILPKEEFYSVLLALYATKKQWRAAKELFRRMKSRHVAMTIVSYSSMMNVYKKSKNIPAAESLLEEMKMEGISPNLEMYSCLMAMHGQNRDLDKVLFVFRDLLSASSSSHVFPPTTSPVSPSPSRSPPASPSVCEPPNVYIYNTLIAAFGKNGRCDEAELAFKEMQLAGLQPDIVSYTALLCALGKAERYAQAIELFSSLRTSSKRPDVAVYGAMIHVYRWAKMYKEAARLFEDMLSEGAKVDRSILLSMLDVYWSGGMVDKAEQLWTILKETGISPLGYKMAVTAVDSLEKRSLRKGGGGLSTTWSSKWVRSDLREDTNAALAGSLRGYFVEDGTGGSSRGKATLESGGPTSLDMRDGGAVGAVQGEKRGGVDSGVDVGKVDVGEVGLGEADAGKGKGHERAEGPHREPNPPSPTSGRGEDHGTSTEGTSSSGAIAHSTSAGAGTSLGEEEMLSGVECGQTQVETEGAEGGEERVERREEGGIREERVPRSSMVEGTHPEALGGEDGEEGAREARNGEGNAAERPVDLGQAPDVERADFATGNASPVSAGNENKLLESMR
eukprot:TRINITY_DN13606_c0_g1_i1.p1 TRINITY_DN13606_c0_g1~~TRINITY_DN13606_c0_g1_i1.p1  ORF type:complete len:818 (-),score=125.17 TRINITY_DN13606_c0_g1_i1:488-2941(-)